MKQIIFIASLSLLIAVSCKKKETSTPAPAKSKTDLLTAHHWKLSALTVDPPITVSGSPISNWYAQLKDCYKDNLTKYNSNNTVTYDEGATKCNSGDPQTSSAIWTFNSTETIITEDGLNENILNLSDNELKMTYIETISGVNYTFTGTYIKN